MLELRPAERLLHRLEHDSLASVGQPVEPQHWEGIVREAIRHGLAPLLYRQVTTDPSCFDTPVAVVEQLKNIYLHSALRNTAVYAELAPVLRGLRDSGIAVIVLKGAFLAEKIYPDPALRPMHDVDLLVRRSDVTRAAQVLRRLGYGASETVLESDGELHRRHLPPYTKLGAIPIEIHWTLASPAFSINIADLWQSARSTEVAGVEVSVLCPEHLLHHLCLHASYNHQFRVPLLNVYDIAAVTRHDPEIDWEQVSAIADAHGSRSCLYAVLAVVRRAFPLAVPAHVMGSLKPEIFDEQIEDLAYEFLTGPPRDYPWVLGRWLQAGGVVPRAQLIWAALCSSHSPVPSRFVSPLGLLRRWSGLIAKILLHQPQTRVSLDQARMWARLATWVNEREPLKGTDRASASTGAGSGDIRPEAEVE